jgi:hypothetical protein
MKTAIEAAKFLSDASIKIAKLAADMDETSPGSAMQKALILRSEIMFDCAKTIKEWCEKDG